MLEEIFKDTGGEWRYRLKGANGEIMVTSEGYTTAWSAKRGLMDLKRNMDGSTYGQEADRAGEALPGKARE